ncbi:dirigent protein 17-like [Macadamia integrifolia]|uniref:dirigent protein 17-like n=1 Tax=Macadamia integrifolia TaxID=60698 RepID=UPI001C4EC1D6|nr:dirigent protein 17-like [Macadamia integrifolia]XP_042482921.1 dirigent protein 17-like [Macadamia integrifolia]
MEKTCQEEESGTSSAGVFEVPGEPAVVINGVPHVGCSDNASLQFGTSSNVESRQNTGFGEWLEGREVRKMFGEQFYSGTVTNFDRETGWYRVVYEDGDFEDLEWHELEGVLLPLEISVPLKTMALKILKKCEKPSHKPVKHAARSRKPRGKNVE